VGAVAVVIASAAMAVLVARKGNVRKSSLDQQGTEVRVLTSQAISNSKVKLARYGTTRDTMQVRRINV
jgi:hypothetical protein